MRRTTIRIRSGTLAMALALLAAWTWPARSGRAESPKTVSAGEKTEADPGPTMSADREFEEQLVQLREDVQSQELWINAKQAQLRAAEAAAELDRSMETNNERLGKKGIISPLRQRIGTMSSLQSESERATIRAELADLQIRYGRTRRQLARLEKEGPAGSTSSGDRALEQVEMLTRLRLAEQAVKTLQMDLRQANEKIRGLGRHIKFEDERK
jgi:hypothetical protein